MKPVDRPVYTPTLIKQKISTGDLRLDVLSSIKGISPAKGTLLLKEFGSIMEIGEATVDEMSKLEGFGKVLAQRILDVLNNEDKMVM
jgi:ERCC4-type nuclease